MTDFLRVRELPMSMEWSGGFEIRVNVENDEAVISADKEGLLFRQSKIKEYGSGCLYGVK